MERFNFAVIKVTSRNIHTRTRTCTLVVATFRAGERKISLPPEYSVEAARVRVAFPHSSRREKARFGRLHCYRHKYARVVGAAVKAVSQARLLPSSLFNVV